MRVSCLALAMSVLWPSAAGAGGADSPAGRLILDETSYNRAYVQFGLDRICPELLRREGEKLLGKKRLGLLKREVQRIWKLRKKPWDEAAWMDDATVLFRQNQAWSLGIHGPINVLAYTPPPPAGWSAPDFDDGGWPRLRRSIMVGTPGSGPRDNVDTLGRRMGCFRYRFTVPDPAGAGEVSLRLVYRGGARVFLNGKEIARGGLPAGELLPQTPARAYPLEAYVRLNDDGSVARHTKTRMKGVPVFLDDCYGPFDQAPGRGESRLGRHPRGGTQISRKDWERLRKLRNRTIGPVKVPAGRLRKGTNLLAVEIRPADLHPVVGGFDSWRYVFKYSRYNSFSWFHGLLLKMELRCKGGALPSARLRPKGIQVWAEDMHTRTVSSAFSDRGKAAGTVRFVGSVNGEFCAQIIVGTDRDLTGLKVTPGPLKSADGSTTIPPSALRVGYMVRHPMTEIGYLFRGGRGRGRKITPAAARSIVREHGPVDLPLEKLAPEEIWSLAEELYYFDHVGPAAPKTVPADSSQPVWLTLKIPPDAKPGKYAGSVRVQADGMVPVTVPLAADVLAWRIPDTPDYQVVLQLEQSPYGVAERYNCPLWSRRHFQLMEASFRQLGRVGNDWLFVPVLQNTELGNLLDSPIKWVRKADGTLAFDFSLMDRYVDLAVRHWGQPRVICFLVMHGGTRTAIEVPLLDETTGRLRPHDMSDASPTYRPDWRAFGKALYEHMRARGLQESMYWGYRWDMDGDPELSVVLSEVAPGVYWAAGGHGYAYPAHCRANSRIYNIRFQVGSQRGWKRPDILLLNARGGGSVMGMSGGSPPAVYRMVIDRALVAGANGVARIAADYWENIYFRGCKAWHYLIPGMSVASWVLWPGENGGEGSQRLEAMREGIQETEARIFLEQALDRKALPEPLAKKARGVLFEHQRETYFVTISGTRIEFFSGWQERSRRLFGVAAEAAGVVGLDVDKTAIAADVPARGNRRVTLKLRNWTTRPRTWKLQNHTPWILPEKTSGQTAGHDRLAITLDATSLLPEKTAKATFTVADTAGGTAFPVHVTATVSKVLDYIPPDVLIPRKKVPNLPDRGRVVFNVPMGKQNVEEITFINRSGASLAWKADVSVPWIDVKPASGTAAPGTPGILTVTARPPDRHAAFHQATLTITEVGGPASAGGVPPGRQEIPLSVYVLPPYRNPVLPTGKPVLLAGQLHEKLMKRFSTKVNPTGRRDHHAFGFRKLPDPATLDRAQRARQKRYCIRGRHFRTVAWQHLPHDVTYNLEAAGFRAFSVIVGIPDHWYGPYFDRDGPDWVRVNFEIHVDGKVRAQSGFVGPKDPPRRLAVNGLLAARTLTLRVRAAKMPSDHTIVQWADATLYK